MGSTRRFMRFWHTTVCLPCPFCGNFGDIAVDKGAGKQQTYNEACESCAQTRVIHLDMTIDAGGGVRVWVERAEATPS